VLTKKQIKNLKDIKLDLGCGHNKQSGWIGLDKAKIPQVEIVHNVESLPWPLNDESCCMILMSHLMEHLDPKNILNIFNEAWRVLRPYGQLLVATPYAGSYGSFLDPTHTRNGYVPDTFNYFDPSHNLYSIYKPRPFKVVSCQYALEGNINVIMEAIKGLKEPTVVTKKRGIKNGKRRCADRGLCSDCGGDCKEGGKK
jgi:SAM-dependent methyltransferase